MAENLVTLAEYKAYAGLNTPKEDVEITALIPMVSALVKRICRRTFVDWVTTPKVEIKSGGFHNILTEEYPIISVTSLEVSDDMGATYTALVEDTDFIINRDGGDEIVHPTSYFARGINRYKLTYNAGFTTLPLDLKLAVFDLITYYRKNDMSVHSTKAPGTNAVQIEYITSSNLPIHIKRVLDLHVADYL
jgi:hypothetical protein